MNIDEEILKEITPFTKNNHLEVEHNQAKLIKLLSTKFQFSGSKINWSKTNNHWSHNYNPENKTINTIEKLEIIEKKLKEVDFQSTINQTTKICYINDSSLDFGLVISNHIFQEIFTILITNVPQHHYFFPIDGSWCLAITMEGFIDYGETLKKG